MRQQLSIRQYRRIDLLLFSVILCLCESVIILAETRWFKGEPYVMSVTGAVCAVVMFRWGPWAGIYAVLGAVLFWQSLSGGELLGISLVLLSVLLMNRTGESG